MKRIPTLAITPAESGSWFGLMKNVPLFGASLTVVVPISAWYARVRART